MKIGIIGSGNMGRALGTRWARGGHQVLFGSRDVRKAATLAETASPSSQSGDFDAAAVFGDVVLYTVRDITPSQLLRDPRSLFDKIVIDCNNSAILGLDIPNPDRRSGIQFSIPRPSLAERLAADAPQARVVKAFNTIPSAVLELPTDKLLPQRISVFVCTDDQNAKNVVKGLAEGLGLIAIDSGGLDRSYLVETVADFIRYQIIEMGRGSFATISLHSAQES